VEGARRFFAQQTGRDLKNDITVEVLNKDGDRLLGYSYGRRAWIFAGGADWPTGVGLEATSIKQSLVAHEVFHNFQWDLQYTDDSLPSRSPFWILEGSAEYAAAKYVAQLYAADWRQFVEENRAFLRGKSVPRLDAGTITTTDIYVKAFLAFDALMGARPLRVLGDYFEDTGRMDWRNAFRKNFDLDPVAYLEQFELRPLP